MKKYFPALIIICLFTQCKKEEKEIGYLICDGKKEYNTYFPLSIGNEWVYEISTGGEVKIKVKDYQTLQGISYFSIKQEDSNNNFNRFIRYVGQGDLYERVSGTDRFFLPFHCSINQSLSLGNTISSRAVERKIVDKNATISTKRCTYNKCIKVEFYSGGDYMGEYYFKKGIGIVYEKYYDMGVPIEFNLIYVDLK